MKPNSATMTNRLSRHAGHRPSASAGQLLRQHCRDSAGQCCMPTTTSLLCRVAPPAAVVEELSITKQQNIFITRRWSVTLLHRRDVFATSTACCDLDRSSVRASEYSLSVSCKMLKPSMRYRGSRICPDKQMRRTDSPKIQGVALTGRNITGPPRAAPPVSYVAPWSVTDNDDRRQRPLLV